jgi:hypothetical protein
MLTVAVLAIAIDAAADVAPRRRSIHLHRKDSDRIGLLARVIGMQVGAPVDCKYILRIQYFGYYLPL